jgi:hypothetical protein
VVPSSWGSCDKGIFLTCHALDICVYDSLQSMLSQLLLLTLIPFCIPFHLGSCLNCASIVRQSCFPSSSSTG